MKCLDSLEEWDNLFPVIKQIVLDVKTLKLLQLIELFHILSFDNQVVRNVEVFK